MKPFDPILFVQSQQGVGHNGQLGIMCTAFGADWVDLALDPRPDLAMDMAGTLGFGPVLSLLDMATSLSIWVRNNAAVGQATLDLRVDYLRAPRPGRRITGRGACYRMDRRMAFVRGHAHDGDAADPLATVTGTFLFLGGGPRV